LWHFTCTGLLKRHFKSDEARQSAEYPSRTRQPATTTVRRETDDRDRSICDDKAMREYGINCFLGIAVARQSASNVAAEVLVASVPVTHQRHVPHSRSQA